MISLGSRLIACCKLSPTLARQIWRHNYVIDRNEYLIFTLSESINPSVYSLQFLFKSTNNSWRYERKCEWVFFFWTQRRCKGLISSFISRQIALCTVIFTNDMFWMKLIVTVTESMSDQPEAVTQTLQLGPDLQVQASSDVPPTVSTTTIRYSQH